jgi:hypothetical protein
VAPPMCAAIGFGWLIHQSPLFVPCLTWAGVAAEDNAAGGLLLGLFGAANKSRVKAVWRCLKCS